MSLVTVILRRIEHHNKLSLVLWGKLIIVNKQQGSFFIRLTRTMLQFKFFHGKEILRVYAVHQLFAIVKKLQHLILFVEVNLHLLLDREASLD